MESYFLDIFKNFSNLTELENILDNYGSSLETLFPELNKTFEDQNNAEISNENQKINLIRAQLRDKPYLLFNKYGDVKTYTQKEFENIAEAESIFNYFEKFSILNNKTDFLFMNDYDHIFLIFLDGKNINYTHPNFKIFRKIFFNLNFFNVKFFVCTEEHRDLFDLKESEQVENNLFMLKRKNLLDSSAGAMVQQKKEREKSVNVNGKEFSLEQGSSGVLIRKEFVVEGEKFELINLTQDLRESFGLNLDKKGNKQSAEINQKLNVERNYKIYKKFFVDFSSFLELKIN